MPSAADALFRSLVQGMTDCAVSTLDRDGIVTSCNAGAERATGFTAAEVVGRPFWSSYPDDEAAAGVARLALERAAADGRHEGQGWQRRRDGSRFWAETVIQAIRDDAGHSLGFAKITRDLSPQMEQEGRLAEVGARLNLALANISQGLCVFDADERLILCNDRYREMHSFAERQVAVGTTYDTIIALMCEAPGRSAREMADLMAEARQRHLDALSRPHEVMVVEVVVHGRILEVNRRALPDGGWVTTTDDVTERRHAQRHIHHLAHHDVLTDLLNRGAFRERLGAALQGRDGLAPLALLYIDLDRFKPINDTWGHPVGDAVLQVVARRISARLRPTDALCRLGGDEFTVMLDPCLDARDAAVLAGRLIEAIGQPMSVHGIEVTVGASVGSAVAPTDGDDPEVLLRNADLALQSAKGSGRNCHRSYEAGMECVLQRRAALERDLRAALAGGELSLHYQPIACSSLRRIDGFEALLRWRSPTRGAVSPADFIPFAEEIGLMAEIDGWVLNTACAEAAGWPADVKLSINLSAQSLRMADLPARVAAALARTGLAPDRLEVEVTETAMIDDVAQTAGVLTALRELGVGIALDDFGTGYSSLSFLLSLPFTRIKVDQSFIRDLGRRPEAVAIVRAVVGLCHTLGVAMTAEGLETPEQLDELRAERCPAVQGYLVGRPSSPAELLERIRNAMPPFGDSPLVA